MFSGVGEWVPPAVEFGLFSQQLALGDVCNELFEGGSCSSCIHAEKE